MKAAQLYDLEGRYDEAMELYERIKKEFPESTEGRDIEKYISRVKVLQ
jgi:tetratricopeptide (TPR) repeat protein